MVARTLLADDNEDLVAALSEVLAGEPGIRVVATAGTGPEATQLAREHQPDVAVLDLDMPGGGADLVRQMVSLEPAPRVLIFTGRDDVEVVLTMLEAGATAFVAKGSLSGDFPSCVLRCAEGERFVVARCADEALSRSESHGPGLADDQWGANALGRNSP